MSDGFFVVGAGSAATFHPEQRVAPSFPRDPGIDSILLDAFEGSELYTIPSLLLAGAHPLAEQGTRSTVQEALRDSDLRPFLVEHPSSVEGLVLARMQQNGNQVGRLLTIGIRFPDFGGSCQTQGQSERFI